MTIYPALIYIILSAIGVGIVLARHGKAKDESYNFFSTLFHSSILWAILYWGGFFDSILKAL